MAVSVFEPEVLKITVQLPVPPESVMVQLVSAPVMATVPVGVVEPPATVTVIVTDCPADDGSGVSVIVSVGPGSDTVCASVALLPKNKGVSGV